MPKRIIRAPRENKLICKRCHQEAAMRMLMNNIAPEVAEDSDNLIVYGETGKAAQNQGSNVSQRFIST
ncbi:hypothetical protein DRQ33_04600 [bacterium]|nr:MAG: hypothetical protein DRQ33_04600 [bacterium]